MRARELMSAQPVCCTPRDTVREAARLMKDNDCGCIPVIDSEQLIGTITDRDIACRCVAEGKGPDTPVAEIMSRNPKTCSPDDEVANVELIMAEAQVRRVPVVDQRGRCIGIIAQADLALNHHAVTEREVAQVVERISEPAHAAGMSA
jgi:CBS domain-containing protein